MHFSAQPLTTPGSTLHWIEQCFAAPSHCFPSSILSQLSLCQDTTTSPRYGSNSLMRGPWTLKSSPGQLQLWATLSVRGTIRWRRSPALGCFLIGNSKYAVYDLISATSRSLEGRRIVVSFLPRVTQISKNVFLFHVLVNLTRFHELLASLLSLSRSQLSDLWGGIHQDLFDSFPR